MLLAGEGPHPSAKSSHARFADGKPTVVDAPFAEAQELIAGFWLIQTNSQEEAIEWTRRALLVTCDVETRQVFEADGLGAEFTPELREQESGCVRRSLRRGDQSVRRPANHPGQARFGRNPCDV